MKKLLLTILAISSIGSAFAAIGDTPYTLALQDNNGMTYIDYILDKSSKDGDRKITRLCTYDTEKGWNWQLFYSSTGTSSSMPDTVFPFYGYDSSSGALIKPHAGKTEQAHTYYENDYLLRISSQNIQKDLRERMDSFAISQKYDNFEDDMLFTDNDVKQFFTRMDNLDNMETSYKFHTGVWSGKAISEYNLLANYIMASKVVQNTFSKDNFIFNSVPTLIINSGTSSKDKNQIVDNFIGYKDRTTRCK